MTKRDWAMKQVEKHQEGNVVDGHFFYPVQVENLLRTERARARRIVREVRKRYAHSIFADVACDEILRRLQ